MSNEYQKLMEESHKLTDASKVQNPATAQHVQQARTITQDLKRMSAISSRTLREY
jgi:2',3'-cyclic-nucleotide 2'-phosphodiesterase (5'-nucleotidase family)